MTARFARNALLGLALCALHPASAPGQDYPSKSITIIVPLAAGTGMDIIARLYGERLAASLGKPVIIENKPGAGFIVPTQAALAAPADGHTLLVGAPANLSYNHILYKQVAYDPEKDLVPISHYLTSPFFLVVNPGLPVNSVSEFIQYAKVRSPPLSYSSPAGGGVPAFAVEAMAQRFDLKFTHVPYRNSPQSIVDIASGHVDFAFAEAGASQALIRDGKLRALAVSSRQRVPAHASIPQRMANMGLIPLVPAPLAETDRYIKSEVVKWRTLLTALGVAGSQ